MRSSESPGRRSRTRLARWSILLGAALLALASPAVAATFGVAALSPTRVYAVGQAPGIPSLVLRWNGSGWSQETTPATGTVWDAAAAGTGTVWAVGQRGNPNVGVGRTFTLRTSNG
jgi:peptidoglycan/LPS O-acetylase OafA/YrhL